MTARKFLIMCCPRRSCSWGPRPPGRDSLSRECQAAQLADRGPHSCQCLRSVGPSLRVGRKRLFCAAVVRVSLHM
eukprot:scaffold551_cov395-Prasinococcus_capsulatus_cf.AAC.18